MAIKPYIEDGKKVYEVYVNGFDNIGRRIQRRRLKIETLRKAEMVEFELKRELAKLKEEKVPYRWSEWFYECMKRMKLISQPSTVINYTKTTEKWVMPYWKDMELRTITKSDVYSLIFEKVDPALTANYKKCILKFVKRIFQMAVEEGIVDRNPCLGIKVKVSEVEQKVLTASEVEIFLREAHLCNHRWYPVWVVALATGMRSGELFALKWTDVDFEAQTISVTKQWTSKCGFTSTKTRLNRIVPISQDLLKFLKELKLKSGDQEFLLPRLKEWEHGDQAKITQGFCLSVGITPVKFHDLRATFITSLLARGESLARVMAIVGHSELRTTNCYLRKAGIELKGATDRLGYKLPDDNLRGKVLNLVRS